MGGERKRKTPHHHKQLRWKRAGFYGYLSVASAGGGGDAAGGGDAVVSSASPHVSARWKSWEASWRVRAWTTAAGEQRAQVDGTGRRAAAAAARPHTAAVTGLSRRVKGPEVRRDGSRGQGSTGVLTRQTTLGRFSLVCDHLFSFIFTSGAGPFYGGRHGRH